MKRLKIASLHCFGSYPRKHATQKSHFVHCAQACAELAEWIYPAGPNRLEPDVVRSLLKVEMGCTDEEVEAFGFEEPRPFANHALPERAEYYEPIVNFIKARL